MPFVVGIPHTLFAFFLIVGLLQGDSEFPLGIVLFWFAIVGLFWYFVLVMMSYKIRLSPTGEVEFIGVLRTIKVDATDLSSVGLGMRGFMPNMVVFVGRTRTARAFFPMAGFHELIAALLALNPAIRLKVL
jgi:hypothetical protein